MKSTSTKPRSEPLRLEYTLAELPSAQHRAGLAGLVLMVGWLQRLPSKEEGICRMVDLEPRRAVFEVDLGGMARLFDEVYAATTELKPSRQLYRDRQGNIRPPAKEEKRDVADPKTDKTRQETLYYYPTVVPRGAFLADWEPSRRGNSPLWVKLWRDMVWNILRGVPATRKPFEARAAGEKTSDAAQTFEALRTKSDAAVPLPSTYYLGAQAVNAENVPFQDRQRFLFLLHFWPFVAQIYVPSVLDKDGRRTFDGYALVVPEVSNLNAFCQELEALGRERSIEKLGYLPRDAVVDLALEGALDLFSRLHARLQGRHAMLRLGDLTAGLEVIHTRRDGNNVRILGVSRLEPQYDMIAGYAQLSNTFWDNVFRKQWLLNLIARRRWHEGFARPLCTLPLRLLMSVTFSHDARVAFKSYEEDMENQEDTWSPPSQEVLIYRMVGRYLTLKLKGRGLEWEAVKADPKKRKDYNELKEKLAREAFLAIRSRTGAEFVDYFTGTLCSVPHFIPEETYVELSRALLDPERVERIRTLTLLALSARGYSSEQRRKDNDVDPA